MNSTNSPFVDFLKNNFPDVIEHWGLNDDQWNRLFYWYISNNNIFQFMRGSDIIGFVLFRPLNKEQLAERQETFDFDVNGEYLYIPLFATKKSWRGRGLWNLVKGLAKHTYPNIEFIAFESFRKGGSELTLVKAPDKERKRSKNAREQSSSKQSRNT